MENTDTLPQGLYLVATPIGNLGDISNRAIQVLKEVDKVYAEDTRVSKKLFHHYEIKTYLESYHSHNEHHKTDNLIKELKSGTTFALISDAGSPCISDPGYLLVRECVKNDIPVYSIPGPAAVILGVQLSGLPNERFVFEGFLPVKKGRKTRLEELQGEKRTMVFYESPHKLLKTLNDFKTYFGEERNVSVSRELTKKFEETIRGTIIELINHFEKKAPKGEFIITIEGIKK